MLKILNCGNSFGIEIEITMKFAKIKAKIFTGISYNGRSYNEGKKITIKDAFIVAYLIFKYFFLNLKKSINFYFPNYVII